MDMFDAVSQVVDTILALIKHYVWIGIGIGSAVVAVRLIIDHRDEYRRRLDQARVGLEAVLLTLSNYWVAILGSLIVVVLLGFSVPFMIRGVKTMLAESWEEIISGAPSTASTVSSEATTGEVEVMTDKLNVRSEPDPAGDNVIGHLVRGQVVDFYATKNISGTLWYQIQIRHQGELTPGWASGGGGKFLKEK